MSYPPGRIGVRCYLPSPFRRTIVQDRLFTTCCYDHVHHGQIQCVFGFNTVIVQMMLVNAFFYEKKRIHYLAIAHVFKCRLPLWSSKQTDLWYTCINNSCNNRFFPKNFWSNSYFKKQLNPLSKTNATAAKSKRSRRQERWWSKSLKWCLMSRLSALVFLFINKKSWNQPCATFQNVSFLFIGFYT